METWKLRGMDALERAVKTFAQALLATLTIQGVTLSTVHWGTALDIAGTAAVVSVLTSLISVAVTGTASLSKRVAEFSPVEKNYSPPPASGGIQ